VRRVSAWKGVPAAIVVLVVLVAPTAAAAATVRYNGPVGTGANNAGVEFHSQFRNGDPRKVNFFGWFNVPCLGGGATSGDFDHPVMDVSDAGRFHGSHKFNGGDAKVTVHGRFKHQNKKAVGTIRVQGSLSGCGGGDTGTLDWVAHRLN
jgi:hypothetical protein